MKKLIILVIFLIVLYVLFAQPKQEEPTVIAKHKGDNITDLQNFPGTFTTANGTTVTPQIHVFHAPVASTPPVNMYPHLQTGGISIH